MHWLRTQRPFLHKRPDRSHLLGRLLPEQSVPLHRLSLERPDLSDPAHSDLLFARVLAFRRILRALPSQLLQLYHPDQRKHLHEWFLPVDSIHHLFTLPIARRPVYLPNSFPGLSADLLPHPRRGQPGDLYRLPYRQLRRQLLQRHLRHQLPVHIFPS
jgi:hypothetical protein